MPFPGPSSSDDQVLGERSRCDLSPPLSLPLSFLDVQPVHLLRQVLTVQNPKKSWLAMKPACSLVDNASLGRSCTLLALAACHQRGMVYSRLGLLSPLFCELAWRCLRAFCVVAIPQSGLLAQVSLLRLPLGHSGQILTLSNAARASLPSPRLLVAGAGICAASLLGELPLGL